MGIRLESGTVPAAVSIGSAMAKQQSFKNATISPGMGRRGSIAIQVRKPACFEIVNLQLSGIKARINTILFS